LFVSDNGDQCLSTIFAGERHRRCYVECIYFWHNSSHVDLYSGFGCLWFFLQRNFHSSRCPGKLGSFVRLEFFSKKP